MQTWFLVSTGVGCAAFAALVLLLAKRRPGLHWPVTLGVFLLAALAMVLSGNRNELPDHPVSLGLAVFFLGPFSFLLAALKLPILRRWPALVLLVAPLAFAVGVAAALLIAVNLGYLNP